MNWLLVLALVLAASPSVLDAAPAKKNRLLTARNALLRMFERELLLGKMKSGAPQSEDETKRGQIGLKPESDNGISSGESESSGSSGSGGSGGSGSGELEEIFPFRKPLGNGGARKPSRPGKGGRRPLRPKGGYRKPSNRSGGRSARRMLANALRQISNN